MPFHSNFRILSQSTLSSLRGETISQTRHLGIEVMGFPGGTVVKNLPASAGGARDMGSIPELGGSSGA